MLVPCRYLILSKVPCLGRFLIISGFLLAILLSDPVNCFHRLSPSHLHLLRLIRSQVFHEFSHSSSVYISTPVVLRCLYTECNRRDQRVQFTLKVNGGALLSLSLDPATRQKQICVANKRFCLIYATKYCGWCVSGAAQNTRCILRLPQKSEKSQLQLLVMT